MTPANEESTVRCARATFGEEASSTEAPSHASVVRNTTFNMRRPGLLFTESVGVRLCLVDDRPSIEIGDLADDVANVPPDARHPIVGNVLRLVAHHMVVDVPRGRAEKYDRN